MRIEFALILAIVLVAAFSAVADDWRSGFTTPDGRMNCCGINDCRPLARGLWVSVGDKIIIFPGQQPTTITIVHPNAHDPYVWVCTTGCAFQPGTS